MSEGVASGVADNEYEVEKILYEESYGNKKMLLVKWKNYPMDQCTWEPYRNLTNCHDILNEFKNNKIVPINICKSEKYQSLLSSLSTFAEHELLEILNKLIVVGIPPIDEKLVLGSVAYLSTIPNCHIGPSKELAKLTRHNLLVIEVTRKRRKQIDNLNKWQNEMAMVCGFNISVVNNVDFEGRPKKFQYVNECVAGIGVTIPNDPPMWCHCEETCGGRKRKQGGCHFDEENQLAYNKMKRIKVPRGTPIYECNKKCCCDSSCINRVVQHGTNKNLKLQIFRTDNNRGWGVKTLSSIKQGTYVTKYSGEVITRLEAEQRAVTHGSKSTYLFDLDYNTDQNDSVYSVDATEYGNISHFINHSCQANLDIYAVWIDCLDPDIPTLALFASSDIAVGEELTFNYMTSMSNNSRRIKCKCQSANCRGYLC